MPCEEVVGKGRSRGYGIRKFAIAAAVLVVAAGWGASRLALASGRHTIPHPTRSLPLHDEQTVFAHGFSPQDLREFLADGVSEGIAPDGKRIVLTLSEDLQKRIAGLFRRFDPAYGVFAAMEPGTGRVVALVGYRRGGEADPWLPLKAIYPAASLIKVVTAAAALEKGHMSPDNAVRYRGGIYNITRKGIRPKSGAGMNMTLEEAIARSANSVFGKVTVNHVGSEVLEEYMAKFGFWERIPFSLPVEISQAEVPRDEYDLARTGAGFGEVYVSPLHVAMMMAAVAAGGAMPKPFLVDRVEDEHGAVLYEGRPGKWRDTVNPETAEDLLRMMVKTIEMGTSRRAFGTPEVTPLLQDMEVSGKTGSLSGWNPRRHFEWFAGVAPVNEPKLAIAALVVNDGNWKIKGSYVGKEAFNAFFGYPSTDPPSVGRAYGVHRVRPGDTLSGISRRTGVSVSALMRANNLKSAHQLRAGTIIRIPRGGAAPKPEVRQVSNRPGSPGKGEVRHVVRRGENLTGIARRYGVTVRQIAERNNLKIDQVLLQGRALVIPGGS
jgi:penicillin-binding protein A